MAEFLKVLSAVLPVFLIAMLGFQLRRMDWLTKAADDSLFKVSVNVLLPCLAGQLAAWAQQGGGWVVLALLESPSTGEQVRSELKGSAAALAKCEAPGCRKLAEVLGPAAKPAAKKVATKKGKK